MVPVSRQHDLKRVHGDLISGELQSTNTAAADLDPTGHSADPHIGLMPCAGLHTSPAQIPGLQPRPRCRRLQPHCKHPARPLDTGWPPQNTGRILSGRLPGSLQASRQEWPALTVHAFDDRPLEPQQIPGQGEALTRGGLGGTQVLEQIQERSTDVDYLSVRVSGVQDAQRHS